MILEKDFYGNPKFSPEISVASGFIVNDPSLTGKNYSVIMTAGHVCMVSEGISLVLKIEAEDYVGRVSSGEIIGVDLKSDLCLLKVEQSRFEGLTISFNAPRYGQKVHSLGAPYGTFQAYDKPRYGMIPMFDGYFCGIMNDDTYNNDRSFYSVPAAQGNSGGPIMNDDNEVVGITSAIMVRFNQMTISPVHEEIKKFIHKILK